jgi:hypothetical protein
VKKKNLQDRDLPLEHSRIRDEVCYKFGEEDQRAVRTRSLPSSPEEAVMVTVVVIVVVLAVSHVP